MAFTNFYMDSGGSDNNAGSVVNSGAVYTSTNGNWSTVTHIFTPTDGSTPANSISIGDYVSIYVDGGTITTFVAQVTNVAAGVNGAITTSATIIYGTAPTTSATARSLKAGGSWKTEQVLAAGGLATFTAPQSTKINIKSVLTVAASRTFSMNGATTAPIWFSGYNTTPGDLDNDTTNTLTKPLWTVSSTFVLTMSGNHQLWSGLSILGTRSGTVVSITGTPNIRFSRCRVTNNSANAASIAITFTGVGTSAFYCYFKTATTATTTGAVSIAGGSCALVGCVIEGQCVNSTSSANTLFANCASINSGGQGFLSSTGQFRAIGCTVYNAVNNGIDITGTPSSTCTIVGCVFDTCGTAGINNESGTNTALVFRACNDFHACSGGNELGMGDYPALFGQTDASSIVTSATDMTPAAGSAARNNGFPGIFENETFISYLDIGAVMHLGSGYVPQVME